MPHEYSNASVCPGVGAPTSPDVDHLLSVFGVPDEGTVITWQEWDTAAGCSHLTKRGGTIIAAWRKLLEAEYGVWMKTIIGAGVVAADPSTRVRQSGTWIRHGFRRIARASTLAMNTDRQRLAEGDRRACDAQTFMYAHLKLAARTAPKALPLTGLDNGTKKKDNA
jgi:hypothetical protein